MSKKTKITNEDCIPKCNGEYPFVLKISQRYNMILITSYRKIDTIWRADTWKVVCSKAAEEKDWDHFDVLISDTGEVQHIMHFQADSRAMHFRYHVIDVIDQQFTLNIIQRTWFKIESQRTIKNYKIICKQIVEEVHKSQNNMSTHFGLSTFFSIITKPSLVISYIENFGNRINRGLQIVFSFTTDIVHQIMLAPIWKRLQETTR